MTEYDELAFKLGRRLTEERNLTAAFYDRMSGKIPWADEGERLRYELRFEQFSAQIKKLQAEVALAKI